jgi:hypothetical protein
MRDLTSGSFEALALVFWWREEVGESGSGASVRGRAVKASMDDRRERGPVVQLE